MELAMVTPLGELKIVEVFVEYDGPRVFSCRSTSSQLYLSFWLGDDFSFDRWLLVPISRQRLSVVRVGRMTLREAITHAEDGWAWEVRIPYDDEEGTAERVLAENIPDEHLPGESARLNLPDDRLDPLMGSLSSLAVQRSREQFMLSLEDANHLHELDASVLGQTLIQTQSLTWALGDREGGERGRLRQSVIDKNTIVVSGLAAASFGIHFESKLPALFADTAVSETLDLLMQLLEASTNESSLREFLPVIRPRSAIRFRYLLQTLSTADVSVKAEWSSPSHRNRTVMLDVPTIRNALALLNASGDQMRQLFSAPGRLDGIAIEKRSFSFEADSGTWYRGKLAEAIASEMFVVPAYGTASLEEVVEINSLTGSETVTYVLNSFRNEDRD